MAASLRRSAYEGLERSCGDWVRSRGPIGGVELLQAWFSGRGFATHRHDTYGIAVTDLGVQTFDYRGSVERSLPGQVTVLHPDEKHDGRAGTDGGFGYRIVYVAPVQIGAAVRAITGQPTALPFVREPVAVSPRLARAVTDAFGSCLEPLARDTLIVRLAEGLLAADPSLPAAGKSRRLDLPALARARDYLDSQHAVVRSVELEAVTGLTRYELARQFRAVYGTSPYRYSLLRRLDFARAGLRGGAQMVDVALAAGFADQAHFTRIFTSTYGMPPGRYARLHAAVARTNASGRRSDMFSALSEAAYRAISGVSGAICMPKSRMKSSSDATASGPEGALVAS
jgi:AraC-like DNA-binding protein